VYTLTLLLCIVAFVYIAALSVHAFAAALLTTDCYAAFSRANMATIGDVYLYVNQLQQETVAQQRA
jgi:hypothetical protein